MCYPIVMLGLSAVSAFMQYQQGQAQAKAVKMEAANNQKIAEFNAQQQDIAAKDAVARGAQNSAIVRENYKKANATARARGASAGLMTESGTFADLQSQNAQYGEYNALTVMNDAEREALGYKNQAMSDRFSGQVGVNNAAYQSSVMKRQGLLDATGTLVTGVGNYGSSKGWWKAK